MSKNFYILFSVIFFVLSGPASASDKIDIDSDSMRILDRGRLVQFTGNVRVSSPEMNALASRAVMDRDGETVTASGNVEVHYSSGTLDFKGWGEELIFNRSRGYMSLDRDVKVVYQPGLTTTGTVVYSDRAEVKFSEDNRKGVFEGNVYVRRGNVIVTSGKALYDMKSEFFSFEKEPVAYSDMEEAYTVYSGENIMFSLTAEEVSISGNAQTKIKLRDVPEM